MLKVIPLQEKTKQKEYCDELLIKYDPDEMCYAAFDGEDFRGIALFKIKGDRCVITRIKLPSGVDDHLAEYLLGKAPLNFADLCGIKKAAYLDENKSLARELEFVEADGEYILNLEGYFESPCHRHKA